MMTETGPAAAAAAAAAAASAATTAALLGSELRHVVAGMADIKVQLAEMKVTFNDAHHRVRNDMTAVAMEARAGTKAALDFTQEAHDRIGELKIWILGAVVTAAVGTLVWIAIRVVEKFVP